MYKIKLKAIFGQQMHFHLNLHVYAAWISAESLSFETFAKAYF